MLGLSKLRPALVSLRLGGVLRSVPSRKQRPNYRNRLLGGIVPLTSSGSLTTQHLSLRQLVLHSVSGLVYRGAIMPSRKQFWKGEIVCGAMWFWILWRFYHDPEEVLGHNPWPDASKWTDEELGIPPDDED